MGNNPSIKVAIFASGSGTNADNIMHYALEKPNDLQISCVICDKENAGVIEKSKKHNVPIHVVPFIREGFEDYKTAKKSHEKKIIEILETYDVNWIFLAGYMRIFSANFLDKFHDKTLKLNRIINVHPSLLPSFPGGNGYQPAFDAGVKISGATIHFVDDGIDTGHIILQKSFMRENDDNFEDFKARGFQVEYQLYRQAIDLICAGRIELKNVEHMDRQFIYTK